MLTPAGLLVGRLMAPDETLDSLQVAPPLIALNEPHPLDEALNVVFVPGAPSQMDDQDQVDVEQFRRRVTQLVKEVSQNNVFEANAHLMNYWMSTQPAWIQSGGRDCPLLDATSLRSEFGFADAILVVHGTERGGDEYLDCAYRDVAVASVEYFNAGAAIHELGHALFNMPDEYGGGDLSPLAAPILYEDEGNCGQEADNEEPYPAPTLAAIRSTGRPHNKPCENLSFNPTVKRPEYHLHDAMSRGADGDAVADHGPKDWMYIRARVKERFPQAAIVRPPRIHYRP